MAFHPVGSSSSGGGFGRGSSMSGKNKSQSYYSYGSAIQGVRLNVSQRWHFRPHRLRAALATDGADPRPARTSSTTRLEAHSIDGAAQKLLAAARHGSAGGRVPLG